MDRYDFIFESDPLSFAPNSSKQTKMDCQPSLFPFFTHKETMPRKMGPSNGKGEDLGYTNNSKEEVPQQLGLGTMQKEVLNRLLHLSTKETSTGYRPNPPFVRVL